jgi:ketosteroid isomerase-like protein
MSQENVQIVRRVYEAAAHRDTATVLAIYDPDVELDNTRLELVGWAGVYHGHEGLRRFFRQWHEAWQDIQYDFDELLDAGEQVVAVVSRRARGLGSGAEVVMHVALVWTLHEGRVVRVVWFPTRVEALKAVGLGE